MEPMHDTYKRLLDAALMIHRLHRPADIASFIDVTSATIGNWKSRGVPPDRMYDIAKKLGCRHDWLREGEGSMTDKEPDSLVSLSNHPELLEVKRVKFKLSAGVSGYAIEPESGNGRPVFFRRDWFERNNYNPNRLFSVLVSGASMEPSLFDGDLVVINTDDRTPHDGDVFAINYEGELVIKRLRRDAGEWWATSDNADQRRYAPKRCTEDVSIVGRAVYKQGERI